jgi:hypothetical protein
LPLAWPSFWTLSPKGRTTHAPSRVPRFRRRPAVRAEDVPRTGRARLRNGNRDPSNRGPRRLNAVRTWPEKGFHSLRSRPRTHKTPFQATHLKTGSLPPE